jgi:DNA polymerase/3'-5' exonuclease PolX
MENIEIAGILTQYADLLEIQGEDLFRVLAYRNAARTLESLSQPIVQLLEEGKDLKKLKNCRGSARVWGSTSRRSSKPAFLKR